MDSQNRINPTAMTTTVGRQTPKNEFGDVLANTLGQAASVGGAIFSGLSNGSPVLSAAVSGINSVASVVGGAIVPAGAAARSSSAMSAAIPTTGRGDAFDLVKLQDMQSKEYLALQNEMQRESREFNAISNILKVRHDSAKAAINNIR
jgi:hypothetical protein